LRNIQFGAVKKVANEYDESLLATDPRYNNMVFVQHEDGSQQLFHHAFILRYADEDKRRWYFIFTEHHGVHVYPEEGLEDWMQMQRIPVEPFSAPAEAPILFSTLSRP